MILVATGHRPKRLGLGYDSLSNRKLTMFCVELLKELKQTYSIEYTINGLAQGFDQAFAHASLLVDIPYACYLPFENMGDNWPEDSKKRRNLILEKAFKVVVVNGHKDYKSCGPVGYIDRDKAMVDEIKQEKGKLVALWDGTKEGGTFQTVDYAQKNSVEVLNVWSKWH